MTVRDDQWSLGCHRLKVDFKTAASIQVRPRLRILQSHLLQRLASPSPSSSPRHNTALEERRRRRDAAEYIAVASGGPRESQRVFVPSSRLESRRELSSTKANVAVGLIVASLISSSAGQPGTTRQSSHRRRTKCRRRFGSACPRGWT